MKIKQTILLIALLVSVGIILIGQNVLAATCGKDSNGNPIQTSIIGCTEDPNATGVEATGAWSILLLVINIMTAGIGIAAVGGVVYGSILYASAGGAPDQVKKAKEIITNVVIGLAAYALMYSLLNFIIPGGFLT